MNEFRTTLKTTISTNYCANVSTLDDGFVPRYYVHFKKEVIDRRMRLKVEKFKSRLINKSVEDNEQN